MYPKLQLLLQGMYLLSATEARSLIDAARNNRHCYTEAVAHPRQHPRDLVRRSR